MKKVLFVFAFAAALLTGCKKDNGPKTVEFKVALYADDAAFALEGATVTVTGEAEYVEKTDAKGEATFKLPAGSYTAKANGKVVENGAKYVYNGAVDAPFQVVSGMAAVKVALNKVVCSQIIIKELYSTGCPKDGGSYSDDAYVVLYNNSDVEADASDVVFGVLNPSNGHATNKFLVGGALKYENLGYVPAYSALWNFSSSVKIPAYSELVVAIFGAIDHTATYPNSVNLANANYYWMSNEDIKTVFKNAKYAHVDAIPASHYLTTTPFNSGNAWVFSNSAPAFFIGKMSKADVTALITNTADFDTTAGSTAAMYAPKFPTANILDAVEVWSAANIEKSNYRFPAKVNTGYVSITNQQGHSVYRNVDKDETEAIEGNKDLLVYGYALDVNPMDGAEVAKQIDAEASIAKGAKIVFSDTGDSGRDFHERKTAALKK